jgi:DNA-binding transcriptional MerR regulator
MPVHGKKSQPEGVKISAAAKQAGVSTQTVEYYILLGLIQPLRGGPTGRRRFNDSHVQRIRLIRQLNRSGYTLSEIRETWLREKK